MCCAKNKFTYCHKVVVGKQMTCTVIVYFDSLCVAILDLKVSAVVSALRDLRDFSPPTLPAEYAGGEIRAEWKSGYWGAPPS